MQRTIHVGLDSQCLSFLIDAMAGVSEPIGPLGDEKKALLRVYFHLPGTLYVTPTVASECVRIRDATRRDLHAKLISVLFLDPPVSDATAVKARYQRYLLLHPKERDCRILSEAEDFDLNVLLTYDFDFLQRLQGQSPTVALLRPSALWQQLGIPRGTRPEKAPHPTNPLSQETWWEW